MDAAYLPSAVIFSSGLTTFLVSAVVTSQQTQSSYWFWVWAACHSMRAVLKSKSASMLVTHTVPEEAFTASHDQDLSTHSASSCQMRLAQQLSVAPYCLNNYGQAFLSRVYTPFCPGTCSFQAHLQPWPPAEPPPANSEMLAGFSFSTSICRRPSTSARLSSKAESFQNCLREFSPDSSSWIGFFQLLWLRAVVPLIPLAAFHTHRRSPLTSFSGHSEADLPACPSPPTPQQQLAGALASSLRSYIIN